MDQKEVVFKVEVDKYDLFKKACKEARTIPAAVLRQFIHNYVVESNAAVKSVYRLIWINLCNGASRRHLEGALTQEERLDKLLEIVKTEAPDAVVFNEFAPALCDVIVATLQQKGYEFYYPEGYVRPKAGSIKAMVALAVANGCEFQQEFLDDIELSYRYIAGTLCKEGKAGFYLLSPSIPSEGDGTNEVAVKRKANMLKKVLRHSIKKDFLNVLAVGGFNSVIKDSVNLKNDDEVYFSELVKQFVDTSGNKRPTVREQRLDYCFANSSMNNKYSVTTEEVEMSKAVSDHSYLRIEIKERK